MCAQDDKFFFYVIVKG